MSCLKTWDIGCHKKSDTLKAKVLTFPFDITDNTFLMQFRKATIGVNENPVVFEWSTADDSFEITDAINGVLQMKKKVINVEQGLYVSDLQRTLPNGDIETLFDVKIKIVEDISRT